MTLQEGACSHVEPHWCWRGTMWLIVPRLKSWISYVTEWSVFVSPVPWFDIVYQIIQTSMGFHQYANGLVTWGLCILNCPVKKCIYKFFFIQLILWRGNFWRKKVLYLIGKMWPVNDKIKETISCELRFDYTCESPVIVNCVHLHRLGDSPSAFTKDVKPKTLASWRASSC